LLWHRHRQLQGRLAKRSRLRQLLRLREAPQQGYRRRHANQSNHSPLPHNSQLQLNMTTLARYVAPQCARCAEDHAVCGNCLWRLACCVSARVKLFPCLLLRSCFADVFAESIASCATCPSTRNRLLLPSLLLSRLVYVILSCACGLSFAVKSSEQAAADIVTPVRVPRKLRMVLAVDPVSTEPDDPSLFFWRQSPIQTTYATRTHAGFECEFGCYTHMMCLLFCVRRSAVAAASSTAAQEKAMLE
jgi:hypothetical protein